MKVWRITFPSDDEVGGAQPSGTVVYNHLHARMQSEKPDQVFVQQGLETLKSFTFTLTPSTLIIYERDELEVIWPPEHKLYGDRFRVVGVTETNFHPRDNRGYILVNTTRSVRAHADQ